MSVSHEQEIETLRARVAELEQENLELQARANRAVAAAQERAYWLDRWHLDLNALMERPGADRFRGTVRRVRNLWWQLKRMKRRLRG